MKLGAWMLVAVLAAAAGGCDSGNGDDGGANGSADGSAGSGGDPVASSKLLVLSTLGFTRMGKDGRVPGFNLDGKTSTKHDKTTCEKPDFVNPSGEKGIDNQFATLVPLIEAGGLSAVEGLLQGAVDDGGLLIMLQVDGIDDPTDDPAVTVRVRAGTGKPLLGTDGVVLSGQTFNLHEKSPESLAKTARIEGGMLHAGPFDTLLPLTIFGVHYSFSVKGARIRARLLGDGDADQGVFGGGLLVSDMIGIAKQAEKFEKGVSDIVAPIAKIAGDMDKGPEGCRQVSMALAFSGVSAFLWDDK